MNIVFFNCQKSKVSSTERKCMKDKFCKAMYYLRKGFDYFFVILLAISFFGLFALLVAFFASLAGLLWQTFINPALTDWQAFIFGFKFVVVTFAVLFVFRLMDLAADEGKKIIDNEKGNENGKEK